MRATSPRITTTGAGYEQIQAETEDGETAILQHHRVLAWVWGELDSPLFSEDAREVHHVEGVPWLNVEWNLEGLTPAEHRERDPGRARIRAPWDGVTQERLATDGGGA